MISIWICIFSLLLKLQVLEGAESPFGMELNPGSGVNFYGDEQTTTPLTPLKDLLTTAKPRDCTKAPKNSSCIVDPLFNDPNAGCQILEPELCNRLNPYRQFDGSCNNPVIDKLGKSRSCFLRFLAPLYDGRGDIRKAWSGAPLPEPRNISARIFKNCKKPDGKMTFLYVLFGQVIAHDLVRAVRPFKIDCCAPKNSNKPECLPIKVRANDPFYSNYSMMCIDFHRTEECKFCPTLTRAQTNGATAALDLSVVYGENDKKAKKLRAFNGKGELKYSDSGYLPIVGVDKEDEFCYKGQKKLCLLTGDPRVNQHASLGSNELLWLREHNRIAKHFKKMNPDWNEEKLFQESRKINIAEYQCIAYKHFLPPLLSERIMKQFAIYVEDGPKGTDYDPAVILEVWNEFGVASYRLHTLVASWMGSDNLRFNDTFSNPKLIRQGKASSLLKGASKVTMEKYDSCVVDDLSKYLYKKLQDLVSINIQRGRDHGLAPYVEAIPFCSGQSIKVESFDDLWEKGLMTRGNAKRLSRIYGDVRDIDLWVGMNLEIPMKGSLLGPTAVCINAKQFFFTKHGDRFFFDHQGPFASFTADQRAELKKCSFARILCDNTMIKTITKDPFYLPSDQNPEVKCEEIPRIDLSIFKGSENLKMPEMATLAPDVSSLKGGLPV